MYCISLQFCFYYSPVSGMLATQLSAKVENDEISKLCIVRVDKHVCNTIQDRK